MTPFSQHASTEASLFALLGSSLEQEALPSVFVAPSQMDLELVEEEAPLSVGIQLESVGAFPYAVIDHTFGLIPVPVTVVPKLKAGSLDTAKRRLEQPEWFYSNVMPPSSKVQLLNSMSDGFYRHQLPDVLFLWGSHPDAIEAWLNDMELYLKKLLNMGFIMPTTQFSLAGQNPIDILMPATVVVGGGFLMKPLQVQWQALLDKLELSYFDLEGQQPYLYNKLVRGYWLNPHESQVPFAAAQPPREAGSIKQQLASLDEVLPVAAGLETAQAKGKAPRFKLAGGFASTQRQVQHALGKHGCVVSIETEGLSPSERLELEAFHDVCQRYLIPRMASPEGATFYKSLGGGHTELTVRKSVQQVCSAIGLRKGVFDELEAGSILGYGDIQRREQPNLTLLQWQGLAREWHSSLVACSTWLELQGYPQAPLFEALTHRLTPYLNYTA